MERQLWRLEDLRVGGAIGFTLELYFLSIGPFLPTSTSRPQWIPETLFVNTFKTITSEWENFTTSTGTLPIILNLVCDITLKHRGIFSNFKYPEYITEQLLQLLGQMIKGKEGVYRGEALKELLGGRLTAVDSRFLSRVAMVLQG